MKDWLKSKTIWFGLATAVGGWLVNALEAAPIDPQYQMLAVGIVTVVLRIVTTQPIKGTNPPQA